MRITMLSTFGPEVRGISYYSDCLAAGLRALDDLDLLAADYDKIYPDWLHPAAKAAAAKSDNRTVHYAKPWTWRLDQPRPDLIHLQAWTAITSFMHLRILSKARGAGIPTVFTLHNPASHEKSGVLSGLERRCLRLADRIVLHDDCGVASLPQDCRDKVRIIPHGTEVLDLSDKELQQVQQQSPYLLYFGNIRPYKGVELLLSAWQQSADQFPAVSLLVAGQLWRGKSVLSRVSARLLGTAKYSESILQLTRDSQLKRVGFRLEFIDDQELDDLIRGARYTIFPYLKFSGHSGAVSRSAANGTPVLVSDVGGLSMLAVDSGNVFPAGDRHALAELLVRQARAIRILDFEERDQAARPRRELVSWAHVAELHRELYRELLNQSAVRRSGERLSRYSLNASTRSTLMRSIP